MPRRNLFLIFVFCLFSVLCYRASDPTHYARYFRQGLDDIETRHLEKVDRHELFDAAMKGMVATLDKHSEFFPEESATQLSEMLGGPYVGIGIQVSMDDTTKQLIITSVMVNTPAYQKNLKAADQIAKIDDWSTAGKTLDEATKRMRGEGKPDSNLNLTIIRGGETLEIKDIRRRSIQQTTVLGDRRQPPNDAWNFQLECHPQIGYIRIASFGDPTDHELDEALKTLADQQVKSLILDLRNNPGGLLTSAVHLCDQFIASGVIVTTRGRDRSIRERYDATGTAPYANWKLAVLVNGNSASASEIVSACLQDHHRAIVIGQRTYGKGTVQQVLDMESGKSKLKLTVADYWRPSGRNIHRRKDSKATDEWGVSPDAGMEIKLDDAQSKQLLQFRQRRDEAVSAAHRSANQSADDLPLATADPQLQKAIDELTK